MKTHINLTIDHDLWVEAQELIGKGNLSKIFNEHLINLINLKKDDVNAVNINITRKKLEKLLQQKNKMDAEVNNLKEQLHIFEQLQEKKQWMR